jgi:hypothetical protein
MGCSCLRHRTARLLLRRCPALTQSLLLPLLSQLLRGHCSNSFPLSLLVQMLPLQPLLLLLLLLTLCCDCTQITVVGQCHKGRPCTCL